MHVQLALNSGIKVQCATLIVLQLQYQLRYDLIHYYRCKRLLHLKKPTSDTAFIAQRMKWRERYTRSHKTAAFCRSNILYHDLLLHWYDLQLLSSSSSLSSSLLLLCGVAS